MARMYIADLDAHFIRRVRLATAGNRAIEIVGEASSGRRALEGLRKLRPDVLLTDIQLPELDGIALLRESARLSAPPAVVICTRFYSTASMEWAYRYGAAYFLCKPVDFARLPELILDCAAQPRAVRAHSDGAADDARNARAAAVRRLLNEYGIPSRLNGSIYLVESVLRASENALLLRNLSCGLYAELTRRMDSSVTRVERSLRSAIDIAYERGSLRDHFPCRPSNKQFIEHLLRESEAGDA